MAVRDIPEPVHSPKGKSSLERILTESHKTKTRFLNSQKPRSIDERKLRTLIGQCEVHNFRVVHDSSMSCFPGGSGGVNHQILRKGVAKSR
jgi:hypothetical protein